MHAGKCSFFIEVLTRWAKAALAPHPYGHVMMMMMMVIIKNVT